jgi:hypothetical protein
MEPTIV